MSLYMNARSKKILNLLLTRTEYITPNAIAQALNVSRRTIYYDIDKINLWLREEKLPELKVVREKGIYISHSERQVLQALLEEEREEHVYIFSPEERAKCIICYIIYATEQINIEQLIECFEISRNTIFADLKIVTKQLQQYDLTLEYHPKKGYYINGDPVRIRAVFAMYFNEMQLLFTSGSVKFFKMEQIQSYYDTLLEIEKQLEVDYVDGGLLSIAALVPLSYCHKTPIIFTGLKQEEILKTKEYEMIQAYFSDLLPEEQLYLSLHLLGSRINIVPDEYFERGSKTEIYDMTRKLIAEFENIACICFENREELERALYVHLRTSMYRYTFGIQIGNVLAEDVISEYPELFSITKMATRKLEEELGTPVPDSEIAYLTLHFGGFIKIAEVKENQLRILIVCVNGISTGNMIKREIQKLLPFAEVVDVRAAVEILNAQEMCDLIISTVKINSVVPVITVHPILTEFDKKCILNHRLVAPKNVEVQRDKIFQVVKKYVDPSNYEKLQQDLTAYIQGGMQEDIVTKESEYGILSALDVSRIGIAKGVTDWKQSIRMTGQCLLDSHSIMPEYVEAIIDQLEYYGPYMFINNDVILAHAKPQNGVRRLDISMMVLPDPVTFSEYRKAKLIIMLAAEDQEKHLRILQDIITLISEPDFVEHLVQCRTATQAMQMITKVIKETEE